MAVHNGVRYLRQSIESVLAQTFGDFEFIIIDDGSTDGTAEILRAYNYDRVKILGQSRNLGLAKSLNMGIRLAKGEYISRQDADDISYPERFQQQVEYLDGNSHTGVVGTAVQWIDEEGNGLKIWPVGTSNAELQALLMRTCPLIHGSTMYRRQCFDQVGGYDATMRTGQDYDFWLRISEMWDVVCLPEVLYAYRRHQAMASVKNGEEQARNAQIGYAQALRRRLGYFKFALRPDFRGDHSRLNSLSRRRLAQRYTQWSSGVRSFSRWLSMRFLLIALLFDPTTPDIWLYVEGILTRKLGRQAG